MAKSFEEFVEYCEMHPRTVICVSEDVFASEMARRVLTGLGHDLKVSKYLEPGTITAMESFLDQALPKTWLPGTVDCGPMPDLSPG